ncbi:MAG: FIG139438: lipoprotein B [uncultured Thiotrichaceae bacterium]|uniref:FIG139438: lipoprotein B n=1 Tax=uncultured Thiotrichaceae bacterium TaxID=298394 RepID=A0A6S6TSM8_9GAMM|nr:MAG: FIG139438: lipoprotein B [uncultured Thiotrichaceae bacterium]
MQLFGSLYDKVMGWSKHRHAPKYLAGVSFAEASFFPIPVAVMLLPMALAKPAKAWNLAFITLVASVLGGIAGYLIGWGAYELVEPLFSHKADKLEVAKDWFAEYGVWIVLMAGFSPVPYKIFTITAGLLSMAFIPFVIASIIGRASQFYLIAFLAWKFGPSMEPKIRQYIEWLGWLVVILISALLLWMNLR